MFVCSVLHYWRSLAKGSSGQTPIGHLRVKKTLTFKHEAFLVKTNFICMRMKNHFHINDYALSLALKQRLGTTRKWLIEIVTLLFIGYDEVAQETGSKFVPQNSPTMHFDTTPTSNPLPPPPPPTLKSRMKQYKSQNAPFSLP